MLSTTVNFMTYSIGTVAYCCLGEWNDNLFYQPFKVSTSRALNAEQTETREQVSFETCSLFWTHRWVRENECFR